MSCEFVSTLYRLRKSSAEAVDDTNAFSDFNRYLHVVRPIEDKLKCLLRQVNVSGNKCLVLLCGSAGDGKSHLISYLKNADSEHLLEGYYLYNDATASGAPELTSSATLAEKLYAFSDDNIDKQDGFKMILAINLGTLSKFVESKEGKQYSRLRLFVENNEILTTTNEWQFDSNSPFQYISFSDYQVFSLESNGINTEYMEELFDKVFSKTDLNPFEIAYHTCDTCSLRKYCPVKHNYEFLQSKQIQSAVIERIVETRIKDKVIVSTRELLNLIYDIIVHPSFDKTSFQASIAISYSSILNYINYSTPMLLNEYTNISPLIDSIRTHDVLKSRYEKLDNSAIHFHTLESITNEFSSAMEGTPYEALKDIDGFSTLSFNKPELRSVLFCFIIRLNDLRSTAEKKRLALMKEYVKYLYCMYSGDVRGLNDLYRKTKNAIYNWDKKSDGESICIDDSNENYWISEKLQIVAKPIVLNSAINGVVYQFVPNIKMRFEKANNPGIGSNIDMDYSLFEMVHAMSEGYSPTYQERNIHTDFVGSIRKLIELGTKTKEILIIPTSEEKKEKYIFENNEFGFEFRRLQQ